METWNEKGFSYNAIRLVGWLVGLFIVLARN